MDNNIAVHEHESASNVWDLQAKDFINSINDDFYVTLIEYDNYWNTPFHTRDLSVYQILSIAECFVLTTKSKSTINTPLNINALLDIVRTRLKMSSKYGHTAMRYLKELQCNTYGDFSYLPSGDEIIGLDDGEDYEPDSPDSGLVTHTSTKQSIFI